MDVASFVTGLKPMLATLTSADKMPTSGYRYEEKIDGIRAILGVDAFGGVTIRSRNGQDLTPVFPDIEQPSLGLKGPLVLDGELTLQDTDANGREHSAPFELINWRASLGLHAVPRAAQLSPAKFVAFDVLVTPEQGDIRWQQLHTRIEALEEVRLPFGPFERVRTGVDGPSFLAQVAAQGGEGIIAKYERSAYRGGRGRSWLKIKLTSTISVMAYDYEMSQARAVGAAHIALWDGAKLVRVGKVGSGLTLRRADDLAARIDAFKDGGRMPVIEVSHLGLTSSGLLRQPVYKGIRADADANSCTYDQIRS